MKDMLSLSLIDKVGEIQPTSDSDIFMRRSRKKCLGGRGGGGLQEVSVVLW